MVKQPSPLEALTSVLTIHQQGAQQMISQRYAEAFETFSMALVLAKQELAIACSGDKDGSHAVEPGISWERILEDDSCPPQNPNSFVFRRPVILRLAQKRSHQNGDDLFRNVCFGITLNMAICLHMQALHHEGWPADRNSVCKTHLTLLRSSMQLYRLAGEMTSTIDASQRSPLEMILLNNLGEAYSKDLGARAEASVCFQYLTAAVAEFGNYTRLHPTSADQDVLGLVGYFQEASQSRMWSSLFAAPMA